MTQQLITIQENNGQQLVNGRELHAFLESKQEFATWIKKRIDKFGFEEGKDFLTILSKTPLGGRPLKEFGLTLDMAKELAMLENNEKGRRARQYFIEAEKQYKQTAKPLTALEIMEISIKQLREQESRLSKVETKVKEIESRTTTEPTCFTVMGYARLKNRNIPVSIAAQLGAKAKRLADQKGFAIDNMPDPRFGRVNLYPTEVLEEVFSEPVM